MISAFEKIAAGLRDAIASMGVENIQMNMHTDIESIKGQSKIERYRWVTTDSPGVLTTIPKAELNVDETYQRDAAKNLPKVLQMAREWSWLRCGAIIVVQRPDGTKWVLDGGHRKMGADRRSDISSLPCVLFHFDDISKEAQAFIDAQKLRKPVAAMDLFKARIVAGDKTASTAKEIVEASGYKISDSGKAGTIMCVRVLASLIQADEEALRSIFPTIAAAHNMAPIGEKVLAGVFFLNRATERKLEDKYWRTRIITIGATELKVAADRASAFYARGGARVWSEGIKQRLNQNLQEQKHLR